MTNDQVISIYQSAIDTMVGTGEGARWWAEVKAKLEAVIAAPSSAAAAEVIDWWIVGDTAQRAASRIRRAAARILNS